jgi:membrane protein DedA with SNARE-associated domain
VWICVTAGKSGAVITEADPTELGGITGWVAQVVDALGEIGVGLLVALETVVPPVPSEVVLAMSGYLASAGRVNVVLVIVAATAGSLVGALALYYAGAAIGEERLRRWLDRLPLVDSQELDRADRWFEKYGRWAVLFGRMVPVVRSLVSVPAGTNRMPLGQFAGLTALGSGVWNSIFVGLGYALGDRWQDVERYSHWFDLALLAAFVLAVLAWVVKRLRARSASP